MKEIIFLYLSMYFILRINVKIENGTWKAYFITLFFNRPYLDQLSSCFISAFGRCHKSRELSQIFVLDIFVLDVIYKEQ